MKITSHHTLDNGYFHHATGGTHVLLADGSVEFLTASNLTAERLKILLPLGGYRHENLLDEELHLHWPHIIAPGAWLISVGLLFHWAVRRRRPFA